jgi:methionyl-tRNA synthetase
MNGDLANDLGNLAQRVLSMIAKNCGGILPVPGTFTPADQALLDAAGALHGRVSAEIDRQAFHAALEAVWQVVGAANRYVDEQAPWALRKTDQARMGTVLYVVAEIVRRIAILIQPFMPESGAKLLDQLAVPPDRRSFASLDQALAGGSALPAPSGVFPRFVETTAA